MPTHVVSPATLHLHDFGTILSKAGRLSLSAEAIQRINKCRAYLDQKIASTSTPLYGINTGFGSLYNKHISKDDLERLQDNLVKSHACGTGPEVPPEIVRLMIFLKCGCGFHPDSTPDCCKARDES
jgi:histidine ammonia-lyase